MICTHCREEFDGKHEFGLCDSCRTEIKYQDNEEQTMNKEKFHSFFEGGSFVGPEIIVEANSWHKAYNFLLNNAEEYFPHMCYSWEELPPEVQEDIKDGVPGSWHHVDCSDKWINQSNIKSSGSFETLEEAKNSLSDRDNTQVVEAI